MSGRPETHAEALQQLAEELSQPGAWERFRQASQALDPARRQELCDRLDRLGTPARRPIPSSTDDQ